MNIGSGWTKLNAEGKTIISIQVDETFKEIFPQLKNVRFGLRQLIHTEQTSENSPHWTVYAYVPETNNAKRVDEANKEITAEAQKTAERSESSYEQLSQL